MHCGEHMQESTAPEAIGLVDLNWMAALSCLPTSCYCWVTLGNSLDQGLKKNLRVVSDSNFHRSSDSDEIKQKWKIIQWNECGSFIEVYNKCIFNKLEFW